MKIYVDFSVFTEEGSAYANVSGDLDLSIVPQIGDTISFAFPENQTLISPDGFIGFLNVMNRILSVGEKQKVQLSLSEITMPTEALASDLVKYMESGFGLFADVYDL